MNIMKKSVGLLSAFMLALPVCTAVSAEAYGSAVWPLDSSYTDISTYFDDSRNYGNSSAHNAIDIPANYGANIYASSDGVCISADWCGDYGYLIILWHEDLGVYTFYAHCSSVAVYSGQVVNQGDVIGYVGNTGVSYGNHLHFGICDTLLAGTPYVTYYDPLTYFSYDGGNSSNPSSPNECSCDTSYAGTYTTHGVETYLNIRNGHSTSAEVVGKIPPNAEVKVTKSDGVWAHIEYNGTAGCCSMEYLQKTGELLSEMSISGANTPQGIFSIGSKFSITGTVNSSLNINRVWGGIYENDGITPVCVAEKNPYAKSYDLSGEFDRQIKFNSLNDGSYIYKIEAEDECGNRTTLISSVFYVGNADSETSGDLNLDGKINISDLVLLQQYLLNTASFSAEQYANADLNRDSVVDVFDMVDMRGRVLENII